MLTCCAGHCGACAAVGSVSRLAAVMNTAVAPHIARSHPRKIGRSMAAACRTVRLLRKTTSVPSLRWRRGFCFSCPRGASWVGIDMAGLPGRLVQSPTVDATSDSPTCRLAPKFARCHRLRHRSDGLCARPMPLHAALKERGILERHARELGSIGPSGCDAWLNGFG